MFEVAGPTTDQPQDDKGENKALLKVPRLFREPRVPLGHLVIVVQNGSLKSQPKGIDPKLQCGIRVEGGAGETEPTLPSKQEWNVEFQFPVSHYMTEVEVSLNTSRVDLVTQETRWIKQASTTLELAVSEYEPWKEAKEYELQLKKGGKGRPAGTVNLTMRFVPRPNRWLQLEKFLLSSEKLVQELMAADGGGESQDAYAKALLLLFWYNNRERDLLRLAVHHEIYTVFAKIDDITQLLRGPTLSAMVLSEFMHIICDPYLVDVVVPLIRPLAQNPQHFEVDPSKLDPATVEKDLKRNQKGLMTIVNKFLKKIISSANRFPPDMGELCRMLKTTVNDKFPDNPSAWTIAMGALIFLRFICPAIVAPDTFGLIQAECGAAGRRCLVLVTKVLQNLVNDVEWKPGYKEEYMACMNPFLEKNKTKPVELYNNILKRKEGSLLEPTVVKRAVDEQTYITLWKVIDRTADKVAQNLGDTAPAFLEVVAQLREADRQAAEADEAKKLRKKDSKGPRKDKKDKRATKSPEGDASDQTVPSPDSGRKPSISKDQPPKRSPKEGEGGSAIVMGEADEQPKSPKGKKKPDAENPGAVSPGVAKKKNKPVDDAKKDKNKKRGGSGKTGKGGKGDADETNNKEPPETLVVKEPAAGSNGSQQGTPPAKD